MPGRLMPAAAHTTPESSSSVSGAAAYSRHERRLASASFTLVPPTVSGATRAISGPCFTSVFVAAAFRADGLPQHAVISSAAQAISFVFIFPKI